MLRVGSIVWPPKSRVSWSWAPSEVQRDKRPPDADYVILADPEGDRFCVVDAG
jgi:hypothetical protein